MIRIAGLAVLLAAPVRCADPTAQAETIETKEEGTSFDIAFVTHLDMKSSRTS